MIYLFAVVGIVLIVQTWALWRMAGRPVHQVHASRDVRRRPVVLLDAVCRGERTAAPPRGAAGALGPDDRAAAPARDAAHSPGNDRLERARSRAAAAAGDRSASRR